MAQAGPDLPEVVPASADERREPFAVELVPALALLLVAVFLIYLRQVRYDTILIVGESMAPFLGNGDRLVSLRDAYDGKTNLPERGDVIVVRDRDDHSTIVKRVVGLPGEWVAGGSGRIWINGQPLSEPYLANPMTDAPWRWKVPAGAVWIMGDNRSLSKDSRDYGPIPMADIKGKVSWRIWPLGRAGAIE